MLLREGWWERKLLTLQLLTPIAKLHTKIRVTAVYFAIATTVDIIGAMLHHVSLSMGIWHTFLGSFCYAFAYVYVSVHTES